MVSIKTPATGRACSPREKATMARPALPTLPYELVMAVAAVSS
jgi:hypothetical protein